MCAGAADQPSYRRTAENAGFKLYLLLINNNLYDKINVIYDLKTAA